MGYYRFFDHTGDAGVEIAAGDLKGLFVMAACAFLEILTEPQSVREKEKREVAAEGEDLESLLVAWLNELLYLFEIHGMLFGRFEIQELDEKRIIASAFGEPYDLQRHPIKTTIKAVTYHQLEVRREGGLWRARIIFDL